MGYIKKEFQEKLELMDYRYNNNLPQNWSLFIKKIKVYHNLIIRRKKGNAICTNCKYEFKIKKKVGEYGFCPNCKNTYLVKSAQLKKYLFEDTLILLDKIENNFVFRYFDMKSSYNNESANYRFDDSVVEYARSFFKSDTEVVNERVSRCQCYIHINHWSEPGKWRKYTRNYGFGNSGYIYPDNLKEKHDELEKYYNVKNREILNKSIAERYKELKKNIYQDKEFIIIPAKNIEALEKESRQQSNCVRTYSEKYATRECDIYFMRLLKNKKQSLVTVEVKNNKVVQSRVKYNHSPEETQLIFLKNWQENILEKNRV